MNAGENTTYYYLGGKLVAQREGTTLRYVHQDHLTGTSVVSDSNGALVSSINFHAFGSTRSGSVPTDIKFTGQRLDGTGLYYFRKPSVGPGNPNPNVIRSSPLTITGLWSGRYYDPAVGRFISPDTIVPYHAIPQSFNRYSYVNNNPLKYIDEDGQFWPFVLIGAAVLIVVAEFLYNNFGQNPNPQDIHDAFSPPSPPPPAPGPTPPPTTPEPAPPWMVANSEKTTAPQPPALPIESNEPEPSVSDKVTPHQPPPPIPEVPTIGPAEPNDSEGRTPEANVGLPFDNYDPYDPYNDPCLLMGCQY